MGCSMSYKANGAVMSNTSSGQQTGELTEKDMRVIRKTWSKMSKDLPALGIKVFTVILTLDQEIKDFFPWQGSTVEELLNDAHFKQHAERFIHVISAAAENVDMFNDVMAPSLIALGEQQVQYMSFNEEHFDTFTASILKVFEEELGTNFSDEVSVAWYKLISLVTSKVKEGHMASANRN